VLAFSTSLREAVDLEVLIDRLEAVVREALQPEYVSLWFVKNIPKDDSVKRTQFSTGESSEHLH
jgi:hypothetical protein